MTRDSLVRTVTKRLDTFHSASYFAPAMAEALTAAGIPAESHYLVQRSAPLGAASAELVVATFFNYAPAYVASHVPSCWDSVRPDQATAARIAGVEAMSGQLLASDGLTGVGMDRGQFDALATRIVERLRPVHDAQPLSGRPLYAAHVNALQSVRATDPALQPMLDLWTSITLLRECRGDAHIAALVTVGLDGLEAIVLDSATGRSFYPWSMRKTRGWTEPEWRAAAEALAERGLLTGSDDAAHLTDAGAALKEDAETRTDAAVAAAWAQLDDDTLAALADDAKIVAKLVLGSGALPSRLFGHGSDAKR